MVGAKPDSEDPFPYKIQYEDLILYMKRYTLDPSILALHQSLLAKNSNRYQYPVYNQSCKSWNVAKDATNFSEILYTGRIPSRIIIAMVASDAYNGTAVKDRLTFEDFGLVSTRPCKQERAPSFSSIA